MNTAFAPIAVSYTHLFLVHHPYLSRKEVPAEMVTASGSGLDPIITPQCAYVQVKRVAQARGLREEQVKSIVDESIEKPFLGFLGTEKVNAVSYTHLHLAATYSLATRFIPSRSGVIKAMSAT